MDLADHHHRAGHPIEAYRWALVAADVAAQAGGATEMLRLLRRALDIWPQSPGSQLTPLDLLQRIRGAAEQAGAQEEELAAVDDLLALVDRAAQPLLVADC